MNINRDLSIEETFNKAIQHHRDKELNLAEKLYNEVIKKDPTYILLDVCGVGYEIKISF